MAFAALFFAFAVNASAQQPVFPDQQGQGPETQPQPMPPQAVAPPAVVYVPVAVPYVVYVPVVTVADPRSHPIRQHVLAPPPPSQGIFAGAPATGIFAGNPATGIFAAPPPRPR